jgi:hypothetical protein
MWLCRVLSSSKVALIYVQADADKRMLGSDEGGLNQAGAL